VTLEYLDRPCVPCTLGRFDECEHPEELEDGWIIPCVRVFALVTIDSTVAATRGVGRPLSDPDDIKDVTSTGRKRAAAMHPILDGMRCEWAGLRFAGGGVHPIVGCRDHVLHQAKEAFNGSTWPGALHHGPDKNVLNNAVGYNLHAICQSCHNRWHALNDEFYESPRPAAGQVWTPEQGYYLHDPSTAARDGDYIMSEDWWSIENKAERGDYPVVPPTDTRIILPMSEVLGTLPHNPFHNEGGLTFP
jgi:hypothetical protein